MAMALVITGFMAMLVAESPTLLSLIFSSKLTFFGLIIAELALVWYLSARIDRISFTTATLMFIIYSLLNGAMLSSVFLLYGIVHRLDLLHHCRHLRRDVRLRLPHQA